MGDIKETEELEKKSAVTKEETVELIGNAQVIEELKKELVQYKILVAKSDIRDNCPYAYHTFKDHRSKCGDSSYSCDRCKVDFFEHYAKEVTEEIENRISRLRQDSIG